MLSLDLTPEQEMLRDTVRGVCASLCPLTVVRQMEDDPVGYPHELWKQLAQLDLVGLLLPEAYGGSAMSLIEGAIVYQELGRALAPTPHFASAVLVGGALAAGGDDAVKQRWLPELASGEAIAVPAWLEPDGGYGPGGVQLRAEAGADGFVLDGAKRHVPFASSAQRLLVLARTGAGPDAVDLFLVDPQASGVACTQQFTIASDTQYAVRFDAVEVAAADRIGEAGSGWRTWQQTMLPAVVLAAAQAVGGARAALDITVQYAKDRHQFGKPLGAFQAIAHYLADAVTAVDGAETLVFEAAWAGATGRSLDRLAPMAKLYACQVFRDVTAMAQQVFGGIGFTVEFDIQLYFRRAKQLQLSWWDSRTLEERVAAAVLG